MDNLSLIKEFLSKMKCSQCESHFKEDSIKILRQEYNYTVIKIICPKCQKNIGLAIMGIEKEDLNPATEAEENAPVKLDERISPITYDDVIDAHHFFNNLGSDWKKYLPDLID